MARICEPGVRLTWFASKSGSVQPMFERRARAFIAKLATFGESFLISRAVFVEWIVCDWRDQVAGGSNGQPQRARPDEWDEKWSSRGEPVGPTEKAGQYLVDPPKAPPESALRLDFEIWIKFVHLEDLNFRLWSTLQWTPSRSLLRFESNVLAPLEPAENVHLECSRRMFTKDVYEERALISRRRSMAIKKRPPEKGLLQIKLHVHFVW